MSRHRAMPSGRWVIVLALTSLAFSVAQAPAAPSGLPRCAAVSWPANPDLEQPLQDWAATHSAPGDAFSDARIASFDGKTYAVFGTGNGTQGGDGRARLFVVNLQTPADFVVIDTGVGHNQGGQCDDAASDCNALAEAELADINGDGVTDWVYAGDLHGNVWAFDLTSGDGMQNVSATRLFSTCAAPLQPGESCAPTYRQPITHRVALARNTRLPGSVENPNINVYWGTGQLRTAADATDTSPQTFYSVLHTGQESAQGSGTSTAAHTHTDLVERAYISLNGNQGGGGDHGEARSVDAGVAVDYRGQGGSRQYGWYIPLPEPGERVLGRPLIVGDMVVFTSLVPTDTAPCDTAVASWVNVLSLADGLVPWRLVVGDHADSQVLDYNRDGVLDGEDRVDGRTVLSVRVAGEPGPARIENDRLTLGVSDDSSQPGWRVQLDASGRAGRVSWYQLR